MRVLVDLGTQILGAPEITQVEQTPDYDVPVAINGKFVLPLTPGTEFPIDTSSYITPIDGLDVSSISFAHLLAQHPQFSHVYFNPLLTEDHMADLDFVSTFIDPAVPGTPFYARLQTGRYLLGADDGLMPTHTALLPVNPNPVVARPGLLMSAEIDISAYAPDGVEQFMLYWKLLDFSVSEDIHSGYGATVGLNTPAIRSVSETDQEPADFSAYISTDSGDHWCEVGLLEATPLCAKTTKFKVVFKNTSTSKIYLAHFAVLF